MLSASTKILLETLAALLVVCLLAGGYGLWRLSHGPWAVPALAPFLQAALSDQTAGRDVALGETLLIWEPDSLSVGIEVRDATVTGRDGAVRARIADMTLRLSGLALLEGKIAPTEITIIRPNVQLVRDESGTVELGIATGDSDTPGQEQDGQAGQAALSDPREMAQALLNPDPSSSLRALRQIRLVGSTLAIEDHKLGSSWRARNVAVSIVRARANQRAGFTANASLDLDLFGKPSAITLAASYDLQTDLLVTDATAAKLEPARLAQQVAALAPLVALDIALDAHFHSTGTIAGDLSEAHLSLSGTGGHVNHPALAGGSVALDKVAANIAYRADQDTLTLEDLTATIEQRSTVSASARVTHPLGTTAIDARVKMSDLPLDTLVKLWPADTAPGGRSWVAGNLSNGVIHTAEAKFSASRSSTNPDDVNFTELDGNFDFGGLRVVYMPRMPAAEQVSGTGHIDLEHLAVAIAEGHLRTLSVANGSVELTDFQKPLQQVVIDVPIKGPVPDMLTLINEPPLGYLKRFSVSPASTQGAGAVRLQLKFPAIANLLTSQIQVSAAADVTGLGVPKLIHGNDLSDGTVHLDLDRNGLKASGTATMAKTPLKLGWVENFNRTAPFRRRIDATGIAGDEARAAFGLDFASDYVSGPSDFALTYTDLDGRQADLAGTADLKSAKVFVDLLGWRKPDAAPASLKFAVKLIDGDVTDLKQLDYDGGGLVAQATGRVANGTLATLDLRRITTGKTDLSATLLRRDAGGWDVRIRGKSFDAHRWFDDDDKADKIKKSGGGDDDSKIEPAFPLGLDIEIDRMLLGSGETMSGLGLRAGYDGTRWQQGVLHGRIGNGDLALSLQPGATSRRLEVSDGDAGALLRGLGLLGQIEGGTLTLTGDLDNRVQRLTAHVEGSTYQVRRAGAFAQLLALISITGIPNVMSGEGIAFQSFKGDFVRTRENTEITRAQASGLSIGLTTKGNISRPDGKLDLAGVIVPINSLNRVIGAIPLLGDILTGGPGGGLFAVSYRLAGDTDTPSVSVNPLSALAPGVLRNLVDQFRLPSGNAAPAQTTPERPGTD